MAKWGRNFFHKFRDKVKKQIEEPNDLDNRVDNVGVQNQFKEKECLNDLMKHEEMYWHQREKDFWLSEGDSNMKFFQAQAPIRKKVKRIAYEHDEMTDNHEVHHENQVS